MPTDALSFCLAAHSFATSHTAFPGDQVGRATDAVERVPVRTAGEQGVRERTSQVAKGSRAIWQNSSIARWSRRLSRARGTWH
eukprot:6182994-Pleurochrysis_carterae.AAC.4